MLPDTVALVTSKELLNALVRPLLLALSCLLVPARLAWSPEKVTMPLPAAVPMSSEVVPRSEPVPVLTLSETS
jgi:hypothetical protein